MSLMEGQLIKPETANGCLVDKRAKREANLLADAQTRRGTGGQQLWRPYGCGRRAEVHVVCGYSSAGLPSTRGARMQYVHTSTCTACIYSVDFSGGGEGRGVVLSF